MMFCNAYMRGQATPPGPPQRCGYQMGHWGLHCHVKVNRKLDPPVTTYHEFTDEAAYIVPLVVTPYRPTPAEKRVANVFKAIIVAMLVVVAAAMIWPSLS